MKPLIGITTNIESQKSRDLTVLDLDYGKAVAQAGGIPVAVPGIESSVVDLVRRLDGFLFSGGDDIAPRFYREQPLAGSRLALSPDARTRFEIALFKAAVKAKKPVLAICYGAQLVNVALGGRLYQDIVLQVPKAIQHGAAKPGEKVFHPVSVFEGTRLAQILGGPSANGSFLVRSAHHQSIKNPGRGLRLAAASPDGVFEALESRSQNSFLIAVQWHPEKTPHDRSTSRLFAAFIAAAKK